MLVVVTIVCLPPPSEECGGPHGCAPRHYAVAAGSLKTQCPSIAGLPPSATKAAEKQVT